jgi:chemotaxis methyl-accepting protein methylase
MIEPDVLERFRAIVARVTGLAFDDTRKDLLVEALSARMAATALPAHECVELANRPNAKDEISKLAELLTVPETYFFRNMRQFMACRDVAIPDALRTAGERVIRLLSMGCASGEEAYSLAMLIRDSFPELNGCVSLLGVDVNPAVLRKARTGRYSEWSLRETPPQSRARWFRAIGRATILDDSLKRSVVLRKAIWPPTIQRCSLASRTTSSSVGTCSCTSPPSNASSPSRDCHARWHLVAICSSVTRRASARSPTTSTCVRATRRFTIGARQGAFRRFRSSIFLRGIDRIRGLARRSCARTASRWRVRPQRRDARGRSTPSI